MAEWRPKGLTDRAPVASEAKDATDREHRKPLAANRSSEKPEKADTAPSIRVQAELASEALALEFDRQLGGSLTASRFFHLNAPLLDGTGKGGLRIAAAIRSSLPEAKLLGAGDFGAVFRRTRSGVDDDAVKVIADRGAAIAEVVLGIEVSRRLPAHHRPNVLLPSEVNFGRYSVAIAMPIAVPVDELDLTDANAARFALQLTDTLGALHRAGFEFSEIKSGNLFVNPKLDVAMFGDLGSLRLAARERDRVAAEIRNLNVGAEAAQQDDAMRGVLAPERQEAAAVRRSVERFWLWQAMTQKLPVDDPLRQLILQGVAFADELGYEDRRELESQVETVLSERCDET